MSALDTSQLFGTLLERLNVGVLVIDAEMRISFVNRFIEIHSRREAPELIGANVYQAFPELDQRWFDQKIKGISRVRNLAFTTWQQRPYLLQFPLRRTLDDGGEWMQQDCTFFPLLAADGSVSHVCITIADATDTSVVNRRLISAMADLAKVSERDSLTGTFNRRKLDEQLERECRRFARYGGKLSYLIFDIDHFKKVNDTYGHSTGDDVIREVGGRALRCCRDTDFVARYGGEELAVIMPGVESAGAAIAGERLRAAIAASPVTSGAHSISITASVGISELRQGVSQKQLMEEADRALYRSKRDGRNRVSIHDPLSAVA
jgi:diguanylate cyclase (GGDEF)-like protein